MIRSFRCRETEKLFVGRYSKKFPADVLRVALRNLMMLDAADRLDDLRVPPANRLEARRGDRRGQHSIRNNDRWRVRFVWRNGNAHDVEIVDDH